MPSYQCGAFVTVDEPSFTLGVPLLYSSVWQMHTDVYPPFQHTVCPVSFYSLPSMPMCPSPFRQSLPYTSRTALFSVGLGWACFPQFPTCRPTWLVGPPARLNVISVCPGLMSTFLTSTVENVLTRNYFINCTTRRIGWLFGKNKLMRS